MGFNNPDYPDEREPVLESDLDRWGGGKIRTVGWYIEQKRLRDERAAAEEKGDA